MYLCKHRKYMCNMYIHSVSHSVVSDSLRSHGLQPARFLCPWNSPGKDTGVGGHFLLQGFCLTQGSNLGLLHCRPVSLLPEPPGRPVYIQITTKFFPAQLRSHYRNSSTPWFFHLICLADNPILDCIELFSSLQCLYSIPFNGLTSQFIIDGHLGQFLFIVFILVSEQLGNECPQIGIWIYFSRY